MPTIVISQSRIDATSNAELMVAVGFATSNSDARRQIANGGFRINGVKVSDSNARVSLSDNEAELRKGNTRKRLQIRD